MIGIGFLCHAQHDNVNMMAREMAAGFQANGVDFRLVDTREADAGKQLLDLLQLPETSLLCTFNNIGLPAEANSPLVKLLNLRELPVFSWYLDHPIINAPDYAIPLTRHILGQTSPEHLTFLGQYPVHHGKPLVLTPHAVADGPAFHWEDKDIPVMMVGTVGGSPQAERDSWAPKYGQEIADHLNAAIEVYDSLEKPQLADCIHIALGLAPDQSLEWSIMRSYCILLDRFLRDRTKYLQAQLAIDCGGIAVGPGWADVVKNARPDQVPGGQTADKVADYIRRSKAVFAGPPAYYSSHERVFYAASHSALPVVFRNKMVSDWLEDGFILVDDRQQNPTGQMEEVLADDRALQEKAETAFDACNARHTYRQRTAGILREMKLAAAV